MTGVEHTLKGVASNPEKMDVSIDREKMRWDVRQKEKWAEVAAGSYNVIVRYHEIVVFLLKINLKL